MAEWVSFSEIKARVRLEQVLRVYQVDWLRRSGRDQYRGRCPIHRGEGREAFHANLARNVFHCFSCGAGGNVLDFVAAMEGCSLRQAALQLHGSQAVSMAGAAEAVRPQWWRERTKLVTKKREVNAPLPFTLRVDSRHPYLAARGVDRWTADYFGVGWFGGPGLRAAASCFPSTMPRAGWWLTVAARSTAVNEISLSAGVSQIAGSV